MNNGFIKLYRDIRDWDWYTDVNTCHLFIHLLLNVNHQQKNWKGLTVEPGQLITGLNSLSKNTGLSIQNVRTSLNKLKLTHELTIKSTNKNTVISINNWKKYQDLTGNLTNDQQTINKQSTTTNKEKKENKENTLLKSELESYMKTFNETYETNYKTVITLEKNFAFWRKEYSLEEILRAVKRSKNVFWAKQPKPELILRTRNKNGDCDYIGEILNTKSKEQIDYEKELEGITIKE